MGVAEKFTVDNKLQFLSDVISGILKELVKEGIMDMLTKMVELKMDEHPFTVINSVVGDDKFK